MASDSPFHSRSCASLQRLPDPGPEGEGTFDDRGRYHPPCDCNPSPLDARSIEALVVKVRTRLDYPEFNEAQGYREAVEALDRLASLAHAARRAGEGE